MDAKLSRMKKGSFFSGTEKRTATLTSREGKERRERGG